MHQLTPQPLVLACRRGLHCVPEDHHDFVVAICNITYSEIVSFRLAGWDSIVADSGPLDGAKHTLDGVCTSLVVLVRVQLRSPG